LRGIAALTTASPIISDFRAPRTIAPITDSQREGSVHWNRRDARATAHGPAGRPARRRICRREGNRGAWLCRRVPLLPAFMPTSLSGRSESIFTGDETPYVTPWPA
jgi:hypothetical protein